MIKKTDIREAFNYERYLSGKNFAALAYYGKWMEQDTFWLLLERAGGFVCREPCKDTIIIMPCVWLKKS